MAKLKILLVADYFNWVLGTLAKSIVRTSSRHDYYFFSQHMLHYYPEDWNALIKTIDLVHILYPYSSKIFSIPDNLPLVASIHHVTNDWSVELDEIAKRSDAIVTGSGEWKEFIYKYIDNKEKLNLFNYGVDTSVYHPIDNRNGVRKILNIDTDTPLIGYSGKYSSNTDDRKGVDVLLKSLRILSAKDENFGILITGPGWNKVVDEIKGYGINEVYYFPFLEESLMPICYNCLDLYVVTSNTEGGPVTALNSMACGVPIVSTPVGMVCDYLENGKNGSIVPKNDPESVAAAISQLLISKTLRSKFAEASLEVVKNQLTWQKTLSGIEDLYLQVWQSKTGKAVPADTRIDPVEQRKRVLAVDSFLWNLKLAAGGYLRECCRAIFKIGWKVVLKETPRLLRVKIRDFLRNRMRRRNYE
jgi:glycosyltransferase involved in cell wall biosynthesis